MKKILLLIPTIFLCMVGCGTVKSGVITCTLTRNDVINNYKLESTYNINYLGETVEYVETKEVVTSDSSDVLDYFEETLNDTYSKMNEAYGGYDYEITNDNGVVISTVRINYNSMDVKQLSQDEPTLKPYISNNKLLTKGIQSMYEQMGAACK